MKNEIGSFYEIAEDIEKSEIFGKDGEKNWMQEMFGGMEMLLVCSGREAVEAALMDIAQCRKPCGRVCLLPQYTCDTTIIPFEKQGWELHFFPVNQDLRPDKESFEKLLQQIAPDVLLAHTYYGVDTLAKVRESIQKQQEKGMIFVEDMTQSLALWKPGGIADYYVGSLRKWFPIPDGGFVAANHKLLVLPEEEKKLFVEQKRRAQSLKYQYLCGQEVEKEEFLKCNQAAEQYLYENDKVSSVSEYTKNRLKSLDIQMNFQKRKENASFLLQALWKLTKVKPVLDLEDGSPLYVPVYANEREELQEFLTENHIFAPVLWPIPRQIKETLEGDMEFIFHHLLALPCDQRYGKKDMARMVQCLLKYEQK